MYGALTDPAFADSCLAGYAELLAPGGVAQPYDPAYDVGYMSYWGTAKPFPSVPVGDESFTSAFEQFWEIPDQHVFGPETFAVETFRVGRIVGIVEVFLQTDDPIWPAEVHHVASVEDFSGVATRAAAQVRSSLVART
jgi:hypothetical protein